MGAMSLLARVWFTFATAVMLAAVVPFLLSPLPPGYAIAFLGFLAVIMALRREPSLREKAFWVFAAFVLIALEMFAIGHDRQQQEIRYFAEITEQQELYNASLEHFGGLENLVRGVPTKEDISHLKTAVTVFQSPPNYGNLKERCIQLVADINALIRHRRDQLQNAQAYAPPLTREKMTNWIQSNDAQFRGVALYGSVFQRTKDLRNELAQRNLRDKRLDDILGKYDENAKLSRNDPQLQWLNLIDIYDMEDIASRLQVLANLIS
jgi:signal transduction histidine kinase